MSMSDDIRSVRSFLGTLNAETFSPAIVNLACCNLEALAEQAELLENTPMAFRACAHGTADSGSGEKSAVLSLLQ